MLEEVDLEYLTAESYKTCQESIKNITNIHKDCYHQPSCNVKFNISEIPSYCLIDTNSSVPGQYVVGYALCEDFEIVFPGLHDVDKKDVYSILIIMDLIAIGVYSVTYLVYGNDMIDNWIGFRCRKERKLKNSSMIRSVLRNIRCVSRGSIK